LKKKGKHGKLKGLPRTGSADGALWMPYAASVGVTAVMDERIVYFGSLSLFVPLVYIPVPVVVFCLSSILCMCCKQLFDILVQQIVFQALNIL
jgi:hypothetical protein